jgi:type II secretory pathway pseudopilin PulG
MVHLPKRPESCLTIAFWLLERTTLIKGLIKMKQVRSTLGFTGVEMVFAVLIIAALSAIYFFLVDSYRNRRMSEQAAKVLMMAAKAQDDFFAKEHHYFDAEVSGNGGDGLLVTPDGHKTSVQVPPRVILSLKSKGHDRAAFDGQAYYTGSKLMHRYDSETGKITTVPRVQDDSG